MTEEILEEDQIKEVEIVDANGNIRKLYYI